MKWEVDLRSRKTGNSIETIYSGNRKKAFEVLHEWYDNHPEFYEIVPKEIIGTSAVKIFLDGKDGVFADVYETPNHLAHGVGKWL